MILRPIYLEKLKTRMWNDSIKVITGIRRSGKSFDMVQKKVTLFVSLNF